jgi:hypothetical protein
MRAVEDYDLSLARRPEVRAPQKVMRSLSLTRLLEPNRGRALRVHSAEKVPNHAILSACVQRLQHHQQGLVPVGVK